MCIGMAMDGCAYDGRSIRCLRLVGEKRGATADQPRVFNVGMNDGST
jgi:hypothetical protein